VPREAPADWPPAAQQPLADFWDARIGRQREIDASIAAKADFEYLYDKPFDDKNTVRVAGPFTVDSLSPHRTLAVDDNDNLIVHRFDRIQDAPGADPATAPSEAQDFANTMLEQLKTAGIQQAHKEDRITFSSITGWPGELIAAEGHYTGAEGREQRAGIMIGPEYGTIEREDLVRAAREAADAGFDLLIVCAFNFGAHATEFEKLGRIPVLKARMNPDLHMAGDLAKTGGGNLFVIFGEPDIDIHTIEQGPDAGRIQVKINGVDVFHPQTGEVRAAGPDGIACWFIDTDYNEESFFVRHAYFLGANDPYKALKTTLRAEIDSDAWDTLHSDTSRPFKKPTSGRIAVKVINHLGDEVMKVFRV
jgi:adenine-specific DNA-methyltransferase